MPHFLKEIVISRKTFYMSSLINGILTHFGSSRPEVFCKKGVLKNFTKFTGKGLCQSLFFNKIAGLKKRLWHRCPVNFVKFLRTPFFVEHLWWLLPPFLSNVPISYSLKAPENLWFFSVFRGYKIETFARNGLIQASPVLNADSFCETKFVFF